MESPLGARPLPRISWGKKICIGDIVAVLQISEGLEALPGREKVTSLRALPQELFLSAACTKYRALFLSTSRWHPPVFSPHKSSFRIFPILKPLVVRDLFYLNLKKKTTQSNSTGLPCGREDSPVSVTNGRSQCCRRHRRRRRRRRLWPRWQTQLIWKERKR